MPYKILTEKTSGIIKQIVDTKEGDIFLLPDITVVSGVGVEGQSQIFSDLNKSNAEVHTVSTAPVDFSGEKYVFNGTSIIPNPDFVEAE